MKISRLDEHVSISTLENYGQDNHLLIRIQRAGPKGILISGPQYITILFGFVTHTTSLYFDDPVIKTEAIWCRSE